MSRSFTYRCVKHGDVVYEHVLDDVGLALVLAEGADGDAVRAVAVQILDEHVAAVGFEGDAVCSGIEWNRQHQQVKFRRICWNLERRRFGRTVAVVDHRILDDDVVGAVCVPAFKQLIVSIKLPSSLGTYTDICPKNSPPIRILRLIPTRTIPRDIDPVKQHVRRVRHQMVPLRRVPQLQRADRGPTQPDDAHQDGPQDQVVPGVQVVPDLAVAVQRAAAVDVDVLAAQLEEGRRVLEDLPEGVGLPVVGVVGELDRSEDFWSK